MPLRTELLPDLRAIEVKDLDSLAFKARFGIATFGHHCISRQAVVDLLNLSPQMSAADKEEQAIKWVTEQCEEYEWDLDIGTLGFNVKPPLFSKKGTHHIIGVTTAPTKSELKKEAAKQKGKRKK